MKVLVLITMLVAMLTPVLGQVGDDRWFVCQQCKQEKLGRVGNPPGSFEGQCIDSHTGKRWSSHNWQRKN